MSRKSDALGTGAIAFSPLVDMLIVLRRARWRDRVYAETIPARIGRRGEEGSNGW